jgi:hypothetical protein
MMGVVGSGERRPKLKLEELGSGGTVLQPPRVAALRFLQARAAQIGHSPVCAQLSERLFERERESFARFHLLDALAQRGVQLARSSWSRSSQWSAISSGTTLPSGKFVGSSSVSRPFFT